MVIDAALPERSFSKPSNLFFLSLCLFVATLYSPVSQLNNIAIMLMGAAWIYAGKYKNIAQLFTGKVALGIMFYYLFQAATLIYSKNKTVGSMWLEYRSPLGYLALLLGTFTVSGFQRRALLLLFAFLTAIAGVIGILFGFYMILQTGDTGYIYNDNLGILFDKQAVYFAIYVNFAVMILVYFLHKKYIPQKKHRNLALASIVVLVLVSYLLASRMSMLILGLFLIGYIVYIILKQKRYLTGFILFFGIIIISVFSIQLFPKTTNRFVSVTNSKFEYSNLHQVDHFNGETS